MELGFPLFYTDERSGTARVKAVPWTLGSPNIQNGFPNWWKRILNF